MRKVYRLIRQLGMTSKYKGYYYVAEAVMMSMELQDYPIKITKDIYPYLAKKFKSTPVNIEHDIRTVINVCWTANKETMDRIAGYPLRYRPTNSEFVDMLAYYLPDRTGCRKQLRAKRIYSLSKFIDVFEKIRNAESSDFRCLSEESIGRNSGVQNNSLFLY
ncbi:MAG: sporulation initiation factor Spo0A C-terminal domain-containing protein [Blautia obeum]